MIVGISGHQYLTTSDKNWISKEIKILLTDIDVTMGITSLAEGTDQIFAELILRLDLPIIAVIPCLGYSKAFANQYAALRYKHLLGKARERRNLRYCRPSGLAFQVAGELVVKICDIMIIVWDGLPSRGLGGTADIQSFATKLGKEIYWINPVSRLTTILEAQGQSHPRDF